MFFYENKTKMELPFLVNVDKSNSNFVDFVETGAICYIVGTSGLDRPGQQTGLLVMKHY